MNEYAKTLARMMKVDETAEAARHKDESRTQQADPEDVLRRITDVLGIKLGSRDATR